MISNPELYLPVLVKTLLDTPPPQNAQLTLHRQEAHSWRMQLSQLQSSREGGSCETQGGLCRAAGPEVPPKQAWWHQGASLREREDKRTRVPMRLKRVLHPLPHGTDSAAVTECAASRGRTGIEMESAQVQMATVLTLVKLVESSSHLCITVIKTEDLQTLILCPGVWTD